LRSPEVLEVARINLIAVFFAGLIRFLSPCVLPLIHLVRDRPVAG
jgi:cytochrome c biogenesis protein CcdA